MIGCLYTTHAALVRRLMKDPMSQESKDHISRHYLTHTSVAISSPAQLPPDPRSVTWSSQRPQTTLQEPSAQSNVQKTSSSTLALPNPISSASTAATRHTASSSRPLSSKPSSGAFPSPSASSNNTTPPSPPSKATAMFQSSVRPHPAYRI